VVCLLQGCWAASRRCTSGDAAAHPGLLQAMMQRPLADLPLPQVLDASP
jgi:hypothetical protein